MCPSVGSVKYFLGFGSVCTVLSSWLRRVASHNCEHLPLSCWSFKPCFLITIQVKCSIILSNRLSCHEMMGVLWPFTGKERRWCGPSPPKVMKPAAAHGAMNGPKQLRFGASQRLGLFRMTSAAAFPFEKPKTVPNTSLCSSSFSASQRSRCPIV